MITPDHKTIAGFYTLSQYPVDLGEVPVEVAKRLPKYPTVSATLLGRLTVSTAFRGRRVGERLLRDALHRSLEPGKQVASAGVTVDAKDASAEEFCKKYGFIELPCVTRRRFLAMDTAEALFGEASSAWRTTKQQEDLVDRAWV